MSTSRLISSAAASLIVLAACGGDEQAITFDTSPPGESTTIVAPSTVAPTTAETTPALTPSTETPQGDTAPTWSEATKNLRGLPSECGNMSLVAAPPGRDEVFAGVALHGLFALTSGSRRWSPLGAGEGSATIVNRPSSIVADPEDPDRFWESGIYNGGGVYRTDDNGLTFSQLGDVSHVDLVSIDLTDPERRTLLAGIHEQPVLYRSTDGGMTWTDLAPTLPEGIGHASSPLVIDAQTHLLGTTKGVQSGILRTTDGGATWERVHDGGVSGAPLVSPTDGTIYWIREGGGGLLTSADGGVTWTLLASPLIVPQAANLVELPDGSLVTLGAGFLVISGDRGATWRPLGPRIPYMPTGLTYSAAQKAFFVWRFDCDLNGENPIRSESILRLDVIG